MMVSRIRGERARVIPRGRRRPVRESGRLPGARSKAAGIPLLLAAAILVFPPRAGFFGLTNPGNCGEESRKGRAVPVISNPSRPRLGEFTLDLERDLVLGRAGEGRILFYGSLSLAVDSRGFIFLLHKTEKQVLKFSPQGEYLLSFGRKGQGPGEFRYPGGICLDDRDNVYVRNGRRVEIFSGDGTYRSTFHSRDALNRIAPVDPERIMAVVNDLDGKGQIQRAVFLRADGEKIQPYGDTFRRKQIIRKDGMFFFPHEFTHRICLASFGSGRVVYAFSSRYRLEILDREGAPVKSVVVDEPPAPISSKEKSRIVEEELEVLRKRGHNLSRKEVLEAMDFAETKPYFRDILWDGDGRLYIMRTLKPGPGYTFDLINADGVFLSRFHSSVLPLTIRGGNLYAVQILEEGGWEIVRFKIRNWEDISAPEERPILPAAGLQAESDTFPAG